MKALLAAVSIILVSVAIGGNVLALHLNEQARIESAAKYDQRAIDRDNRLSKACAAGQTGVVSYYKGVFCADNYKG